MFTCVTSILCCSCMASILWCMCMASIQCVPSRCGVLCTAMLCSVSPAVNTFLTEQRTCHGSLVVAAPTTATLPLPYHHRLPPPLPHYHYHHHHHYHHAPPLLPLCRYLYGLPVLIKDLTAVAGVLWTSGSLVYKDRTYPHPRHTYTAHTGHTGHTARRPPSLVPSPHPPSCWCLRVLTRCTIIHAVLSVSAWCVRILFTFQWCYHVLVIEAWLIQCYCEAHVGTSGHALLSTVV